MHFPVNDLPPEWVTSFERRLDQAKVSHANRQAYPKRVKFYVCFCQKFGCPATAPTALGAFLTKLAEKKHSIVDRHQTAIAVRLFLRYEPQERNLYLQLSTPNARPAPADLGPSLEFWRQGGLSALTVFPSAIASRRLAISSAGPWRWNSPPNAPLTFP